MISIDFGNMFRQQIGAYGISINEFEEALKKAPEMHKGMTEKKNDMAWRGLMCSQADIIKDIKDTAKKINEDFENFVIFGIGGSALGPKALFTGLKHYRYNELSKEVRGGARFYVEDNADPDRLKALFDVIDMEKTVFNVISKSGNTVETMSQFILVLDMLKKRLKEGYRENIIVTTDEHKGDMKKNADENGFKTYFVPEGVGGRFSVFCPVGLLGAAVLNIDIGALLKGAAVTDGLCSEGDPFKNPAYMYALLFTAAMKKGINISVMMPYADALFNTAQWYAQLWAESLGKKYDNAKKEVFAGQTPVSAIGTTDQHSQIQLYTEGPFDKIITLIEVENFRSRLEIPAAAFNLYGAEYLKGASFNALIASECLATEYALAKAGRMNMKITLERIDEYSMGALLYFFEMATAAAGEALNINAFDQPGVEEGKNATYALMGRKGYEKIAAELKKVRDKDKKFIFNI